VFVGSCPLREELCIVVQMIYLKCYITGSTLVLGLGFYCIYMLSHMLYLKSDCYIYCGCNPNFFEDIFYCILSIPYPTALIYI
jgi:hypothetical protein